ncbi:hypothetical protein NIES4101_67240 [Calothrix sp. NIES-4101]|nr:hypothetical protein NIES4101_67240 [Calothrix sp. NIES-4101]
MEEFEKDQFFLGQVQKLHRLTVYGRWIFVASAWLLIIPFCLWNLRSEISLWRQYFTWVAVRYGLYYHPFATIGLAFCIGSMLAVLIWQSRNILFGLPKSERQRLEKMVCRIREQGETHPLWKWIQ